LSRVEDLARKCSELGIPALGLSDHGVMSGSLELIKACNKYQIKPIIGNEMYIDAEKKVINKKYFHLLVLAKNTEGYRNLVKLTTLSHKNSPEGEKPVINREIIAENKKGLIIASGCLGGEIPQLIFKYKESQTEGNWQEVLRNIQWYKESFGDNYYLELQWHGNDQLDERYLNRKLVELSKNFNIPWDKNVLPNTVEIINFHDKCKFNYNISLVFLNIIESLSNTNYKNYISSTVVNIKVKLEKTF
jgi:DNA polymerase-3 subunit alpha